MYISKTFKPLATVKDNQVASEEWLEKAARYEREGKSAGILKMAFNKALDYETAARQGG